MIEWCGFDIFVFAFFDKISMRRSRYVSTMRANGCFLIPNELIDWVKHFSPDSNLELRVVRDEDGDSVIKCTIKCGKVTNVFRAPASERVSIEWERAPLASVEWTSDMTSAVKCMTGPVHVDMHCMVKFACGFSSAAVDLPVDGEAVGVYSGDCLRKIDITGKMRIHASKVMEIESHSVLYLFAPIL